MNYRLVAINTTEGNLVQVPLDVVLKAVSDLGDIHATAVLNAPVTVDRSAEKSSEETIRDEIRHCFAVLDFLTPLSNFRRLAGKPNDALGSLLEMLSRGDFKDPHKLTLRFLSSCTGSPGELPYLAASVDDTKYIAAREKWIALARLDMLLVGIKYHFSIIARALLPVLLRSIANNPLNEFTLKALQLLTYDGTKRLSWHDAEVGDLLIEIDEQGKPLLNARDYFLVTRLFESDEGGMDLYVDAHTGTKEEICCMENQRFERVLGIYCGGHGLRQFQLRSRPVLFDLAKANFDIPRVDYGFVALTLASGEEVTVTLSDVLDMARKNSGFSKVEDAWFLDDG